MSPSWSLVATALMEMLPKSCSLHCWYWNDDTRAEIGGVHKETSKKALYKFVVACTPASAINVFFFMHSRPMGVSANTN